MQRAEGWEISTAASPPGAPPGGAGAGLTSDSDAGVDGGVPAGADDHHVVGLGQLALDEQSEHLGEALGQGVGALDDVHAVIAGAGSQAGQPGQLRGGDGRHRAGRRRERLRRRLLVLADLRQVRLAPGAQEDLLQVLHQGHLVRRWQGQGGWKRLQRLPHAPHTVALYKFWGNACELIENQHNLSYLCYSALETAEKYREEYESSHNLAILTESQILFVHFSVFFLFFLMCRFKQ